MSDQQAVDHALAKDLFDMEHLLGWSENVVLTQFVVRKGKDGWLCLIKAMKGKKPVIAFIGGSTFASAVESGIIAVSNGLVKWKPDRFPPST